MGLLILLPLLFNWIFMFLLFCHQIFLFCLEFNYNYCWMKFWTLISTSQLVEKLSKKQFMVLIVKASIEIQCCSNKSGHFISIFYYLLFSFSLSQKKIFFQLLIRYHTQTKPFSVFLVSKSNPDFYFPSDWSSENHTEKANKVAKLWGKNFLAFELFSFQIKNYFRIVFLWMWLHVVESNGFLLQF